jgi:dienelactone hydrolase
MGIRQRFDVYSIPIKHPDLTFSEETRPFRPGLTNTPFKPAGSGPFPALVVMPTCAAHTYSLHTFDWAQQALSRGYAVLVVETLKSRGVSENCAEPRAVPLSRIVKDAFDAANYLRHQPFVDPTRICLIGFSQGATAALGAASSQHAPSPDSVRFRAIVSLYPTCFLANMTRSEVPYPVDVSHLADKIEAPTLVLMGDLDTGAGPDMGGCKSVLEDRKAKGEPVDYEIYHATHIWDWRELPSYNWGPDDGTYDSEITRRSVEDAFAFFDKQLKAT